MTITWTRYDDANDTETDLGLPSIAVTCDVCEGKGAHSNRLGDITGSEWERDWSPDEREAYMAGRYDARCDECKGTGKVEVIDWASLETLNPAIAAEYRAHLEEERHFAVVQAAERRAEMGYDGYGW